MLSVLPSAAHSSDLVGMFRDGVVGGGELGGAVPCRSQKLRRAVQELSEVSRIVDAQELCAGFCSQSERARLCLGLGSWKGKGSSL